MKEPFLGDELKNLIKIGGGRTLYVNTVIVDFQARLLHSLILP